MFLFTNDLIIYGENLNQSPKQLLEIISDYGLNGQSEFVDYRITLNIEWDEEQSS